jgi:CSLREA domain-containing protein
MPTEDQRSDRPHPGVPQSVLALMPPHKISAPTVGVALLVWGLLFAYVSSPAWANTINVDTLADEQNTNTQCSLREAIINANADDQSGSSDCEPGIGDDVINIGVTGR